MANKSKRELSVVSCQSSASAGDEGWFVAFIEDDESPIEAAAWCGVDFSSASEELGGGYMQGGW